MASPDAAAGSPPEAAAPAAPPSLPAARLVRADRRVTTRVLGNRRRPLSDLYYSLLSAPWAVLFAALAAGYVGVNFLFAIVYAVTGGVDGARPGSLADAFFFSVQTMATIGYGVMHPVTPLANVLVTVEALLGLLGVAMATGVLFAKFARPSAQLSFSAVAVVSVRDGVPSLMFRVANARVNHVAEATMRVHVVRDEVTTEGERVRRWHELALDRSYSPIFALTWTAIHRITPDSKLWCASAEALAASNAEIIVTLVGLDSDLSATIHARHSYVASEIRWGMRLADILVVHEGLRAVDLRRFDEVVPAPLPGDCWTRVSAADAAPGG
jgi:inward rectifier potassium channel